MFWRKKAPPQTVEQQAVQSPVSRFNPNWRFTYERKELPQPGAMNYAYENLGLPEYTVIGPSVANRMQFNPMQPQQAYAGFTLGLQGLGGLVQGTMYMSPLIAPTGTTADEIHS